MKCTVCNKEIGRPSNLKRHTLLHDLNRPKKFKCDICHYETHRKTDLTRHNQKRHALNVAAPHQSFRSGSAVRLSQEVNAQDSAGTSGVIPDNPIPEVVSGMETNLPGPSSAALQMANIQQGEIETPNTSVPRIITIIQENLSRIQTYKRVSKRHQDRYNFKLESASLNELEGFLNTIYQAQSHPFKLNLSFGFILKNIYTDQLVYYYASQNNRIFAKPVLIQEQSDLEKALGALSSIDLLEYCRQQRPSTKFLVMMITNALFYVNKLKKFHIGCPVNLPDYIEARRSLICFQNDRHGHPYSDNLCFFRCLAYHLEPSYVHLQERTFEKFREYMGAENGGDFQGITLEEIPAIEDRFRVNIEVYSLNRMEDEESGQLLTVAHRVYASRLKYTSEPLRLNLYEGHFSLIVNIRAYVKRWCCKKCDKLFNHLGHLKTHERSCIEGTKVKFRGGGFGMKKNVFELLTEQGVDVPMHLRFFPFRLAFDFESICKPQPEPEEPEPPKQQITAELEPASVSVSSNVPGFTEPRFFLSDGNPETLISNMYSYIVEISNRSREILTERFSVVLDDLRNYTDEHETLRNNLEMRTAGSESDEEYICEQDRQEIEEIKDRLARLEIYSKLSKRLDSWIGRIVCLGFNTGKFDINLIRKYLFPYVLNNHIEIDQIIKRNNDYLSITTDHAVFLDIKNYLAAGISYDKWLKSNDIRQTKGFFPYEWFTDLDKLRETALPSHEQFWSSLKQSNISNEDYQYIQRVWEENGFRTMLDLLEWYNHLDTMPFLEAAQKLYDYWTCLDIDPFKGNAISLPGLALCYLWKKMEPFSILPIFDDQHKELYYLIRKNIVGGLSIVMHRYHERGITLLPNGCAPKTVISFDCNSLYLWALGQSTGTGLITVWRGCGEGLESLPWKLTQDPDVKARWFDIQAKNMDQLFYKEPGFSGSRGEVEWLEWMILRLGRRVEHRFNGRQKVIVYSNKKRYPVDGYVPDLNLVLQYNGCYWHGHGCRLDKNNPERSHELRAKTEEIAQRITSLGFQLQQKWECEWMEDKKTDTQIQQFLSNHLMTITHKIQSLTAKEILDAIANGLLFGMIECDIEVPFWNQELLDHYEEFPPICKNTEVSMSDIGPHMQQYAEENGYMKTPRKMLINSFWGRKILLSTSLVQWYQRNGLVVTRLYSFIEMKPKECFGNIRDHIADQRRRADVDPAYKASGESWKTLGNSLYGKAMTNKEKHKDHSIVLDGKVSDLVNDQRFHHMEEVGDEAYEVAMDKKVIEMDLPLTVASFVYNNAKLRMLEFVYDFLKRYLRPGSYQMVCSDTDSIIAAYESENIDDLVKPELHQEYTQFGRNAFLAHDQYSARTPGLFKVELSATGIVALCSKTYHAWNDDTHTTKTSSKGLSKRTNTYTKDTFLDILRTQVKGSGINYGFRMFGTTLCQYSQRRDGLAYLYVKRRVANDGISTRALHL